MIPSTGTLLNRLFAALSIGRVPYMRYNGKPPPSLAHSFLEGYEVCTYYAMSSWCKTLDDMDHDERSLRPVLAHHLGIVFKNPVQLLTSFEYQNRDRTRLIAAATMTNKPFFWARGEAILMEYETAKLNIEPQRAKKIYDLL